MNNNKINNGSALIGAIMVASVLSVIAAGFIRVSTLGGNNANAALLNEQAFQAGETGVLMGARWLRSLSAFPQSGSAAPFSSYLTVNNMDVVVSINYGASGGSALASIAATVYKDPSGAHAQNSSTFVKRIIMTQVSQQSFGKYATLVDAVEDYTNWAGYANRVFSGRFHMNSRIKISGQPNTAQAVTFKNGLVTVGTNNSVTNTYGVGTHDNNNYNSGVQLGWSPTAAQGKAACDLIFQSQYRANQPNIQMPTTVNTTALASMTSAIQLPKSIVDEGNSTGNYRPTLVFSIDNNGAPLATYYYKDTTMTSVTTSTTKKGKTTYTTVTTIDTTCESQPYPNYTGSILMCNQNLNVYGTVQGKVTVTTAIGKDILPVANLVYSDFNTTTTSLPATSTNVLALVAGNNIRFNQSWERELTKGAVSQVTMTGIYNINGSLMAVQNNGTETGTTYWDRNVPCNYGITVYGNQVMRTYRPITGTSNGLPSSGAMQTVSYYQDTRLANNAIQPPGYPKVQTSTGLWMLSLDGWKEENVY